MSTTTNETTDRALLPPGYYKARADKATLMFGKASTGNPQIALTFDINDPKAEGYQQRITWIGTLAGGAIENVLDGFIAAGWTGTDPTQLSAGEGIGEVECSLKVKHEADQEGVMRVKVDYVNPLRGAFKFKKEMEAAEVADLGEQLAGEIMAARERAGARGRGPTSGAAGKPAGGGYGSPTRNGGGAAKQKPWDGTGPDPSGGKSDDDIPFASCDPLHDPMTRWME